MTRQKVAIASAATLITLGLAWLLFVGLPRWYARPAPVPPAAATTASASEQPVRKIKARLYYVSEDGQRLVGTETEVPFAEQPMDQAREILNAQLAPVAEPLVSAIPAGTTLKALFVTNDGEAFIDLSSEIATAHPGGSLSELLTIFTVVHSLTFNMPAIRTVQLLVNGKEVETLAGHIDLRRPLSQNLQLTIEN